MKATDVSDSMGISREQAEQYLANCDDIVEGDEFVATRQGSTVHLAVKVKGLGGRKVLRACNDIIERWFKVCPVLYAPVKHENEKAAYIAMVLGFRPYSLTDTHTWLAKEANHA